MYNIHTISNCIIECSVQGWKALENFGTPSNVLGANTSKDCQEMCKAPFCRSFSSHVTGNSTFHCNHFKQNISISKSERDPSGRVGIATST